MVAGTRRGPRLRGQRLAAAHLPAAPPPARAADLARHDAQAPRPRPARRDARDGASRSIAARAPLERAARAELHSAKIFRRPTRSAARSGRRATRATTCSPTRPGQRRVRDRVGSRPDARVVLYAPTWRDDRERDGRLPRPRRPSPTRAARPRPPGARPLAHARFRLRTCGRAPIDVTSYPDVTDLMLVADVLVTDYSSVMFDFAATEKAVGVLHPRPRALPGSPARVLLRPARRCARDR